MKGISHLATVLLVALTITWVSAEAENQTESSIPTECPAENGDQAVHIAHESDCGLFYKCDHGEKVLHTCPSGLAFNPALEVCDWPKSVGCTPGNSDDTDGSDSGISSSSNPSEVESTSESGNENIVASSTTEAASVSSEGPGSDVTEAAVIPTECPAENGDHAVHIAHESDCGLFYQCNHGEKVLKQCTSGLAFNPALQVCDWPENVGCTPGNSDDTDGSDSGISSSSIPSEVDSTSESGNDNNVASSTTEAASVSSEGPGSDVTEAAVIPTECPAENGDDAVHIAHESDCGLFYQCNHGEKVLRQCTSGLAFNPTLQVCDWPENVGCTPGNSDDTDGSDSGTSSSSSQSEVESTSESDNENIVASSTTEAASVSSEGPGSDVTEAAVIPTECPAENGDHAVHIAHESDCGLFYQCNHGKKVLKQCTSGLAFNPVLQVCDWPENVGCTPGNSDDTDGSDSGISSSSSPSEVESTSESDKENIVASSTTEAASVSSEGPGSDVTEAAVIPTECPAEDGDDAVHIAHESDCGLFYQCNHGEKVLRQCSSGLAFNPASQVCDWPKNVGCTPGSSDDTDGNEVASSTESSNDVIESSSSPEVELPNNESSSSAPDANNPAEDDSDSSEDSDADDSDSSDSDNDDSNGENSTAAPNNSDEAGSGEEDAGSELPTECPATNEGEAVLIAHESDCGSFYKCNHGEKVEFKCPSGLNFNAALKVCDWPKDAGCTASDSDDSGNSDSGDSENSHSNEVESNDANDESDSAEHVSGNSEESDSDNTESEAVIPPTECPADNEGDAVHIAHESDCGSFYKCDHGKKVEQRCPPHLHFNAASQVCDWPQSAGCIKPN